MTNNSIEEQLCALSANGDYEALCERARQYLLEPDDAKTAHTVRILLGEALLTLTAKAFDEAMYIEGIHALITAYNERADRRIYDILYELCCISNEDLLRKNYETNRAVFLSEGKGLELSSYDDLPVKLFPLTDYHSILFDIEREKFLLGSKETGMQELWHTLIFAGADSGEITRSAARFARAAAYEERRKLEETLTEAIRAQNFTKAVQGLAEKYHALYPYGELYEIYQAEQALAEQRIGAAIRCAKAAYHKRKMSAVVGALLHRVYQAKGDYANDLRFMALFDVPEPPRLPPSHTQLAQCLRSMTAACTDTRFAPVVNQVSLVGGTFSARPCAVICEELPRFSKKLPAYWAGIYNPYGQMHVREQILTHVNAVTTTYDLTMYNHFTFDLVKAEETSKIQLSPQKNTPVLIPISARKEMQQVRFYNKQLDRVMMLSRGEFSFYRIDHPVTVCSNDSFIVGQPIALQHNPKRKKVVLNILADGLSWQEMRRNHYALIPNMMRFFNKGVIFDNQFSTAEYTYPALASIETGIYQHKTQIAEPGKAFALDEAFVTVSEQMKRLGYYCVNIQGCSEGVYNGATRGYDRLIVNYWNMQAADGVERTIRHLDAFEECDNFLFMHFSDTHPFNSDVATPEQVQTHLGMEDLLQPQDMGASVFLRPNPLSQYVNREAIKEVDRQLGYLFDYITSHYEDDEYIVLLYSDHGASVYARSPYLLSEEQTGAALMARGAGVPSLGRVDELASSVDIYKILGKLAGYPIDAAYLDGNLPEAFGGQRREYTVTNSIYPGQTYKICVRTAAHAFHLETKEATGEDGKISLADYTYHMHERNESYREIFDDALARYFLDIVWAYTEPFRR